MKSLIILGSTGSIGTQALEVCRRDGYKVTALAAGSNIELLEKQDAAIEKQLLSARRRQEEFRVLSENMDEGLVVVDRHGTTVSANAVARAFMEAGAEGDVITEVLDVARGGRHTERSVTHGGRYYRVIGSPVLHNESIACPLHLT